MVAKGSVRRRLREARKDSTVDLPHRRKRKSSENLTKVDSNSACIKRWLWLNFDDVDPEKFIGLQCKVYWPLDGEWYRGCIIGYDLEANRHQVQLSFDMQHLNLSLSVRSLDSDDIDYDEMVVLAASWNDCQDHEPGDIIWAKLTGRLAIALDHHWALSPG
ncbi:Histone-lysine N-methyltransferase ATX2 [Vitis vinifera]|uniref:Histone-lysine N-methyltransferase ATX2 n=1 Tax=Vitis vinifera TaxID=29760 RepID=A0A438DKR1_VITVI|nr:Histone-lysine N-methyltransferase ATX2 [Vitis vinifera]